MVLSRRSPVYPVIARRGIAPTWQSVSPVPPICHCEEAHSADVAIRSPFVSASFYPRRKGMRIATTSVRTGFAMTGRNNIPRRFLHFSIHHQMYKPPRGLKPLLSLRGACAARDVAIRSPVYPPVIARRRAAPTWQSVSPFVSASFLPPPQGDADCRNQCAHWLRNDR